MCASFLMGLGLTIKLDGELLRALNIVPVDGYRQVRSLRSWPVWFKETIKS